jgi:hypothetical protein
MEEFWFNKPNVLISTKSLHKFIPTNNMTYTEKLNAVARFSIYYFLIIMFTSKNIMWLSVSVSILLFTICVSRVEKFTETSKKKCTMPTKDNPFMNFTIGDYHVDPSRLPACDPFDKDVKRDIKNHFNHNLFRNSNDIFNRDIQNRQWLTQPVTEVVNDQKKFAEWLYGSDGECKSAGINCLKNLDMRYDKEQIIN